MMSTLKKTYITLAITVITVFLGASTATAAYKTDVVSDMALIYQGGNHRPEWTEDELRPYVVHTFADGRMEWFFDSFLFFEFTDSWQIAFGSSYGTRNAQRSDWEWLLNRVCGNPFRHRGEPRTDKAIQAACDHEVRDTAGRLFIDHARVVCPRAAGRKAAGLDIEGRFKGLAVLRCDLSKGFREYGEIHRFLLVVVIDRSDAASEIHELHRDPVVLRDPFREIKALPVIVRDQSGVEHLRLQVNVDPRHFHALQIPDDLEEQRELLLINPEFGRSRGRSPDSKRRVHADPDFLTDTRLIRDRGDPADLSDAVRDKDAEPEGRPDIEVRLTQKFTAIVHRNNFQRPRGSISALRQTTPRRSQTPPPRSSGPRGQRDSP